MDYVFTDPPFGNNIHYADCNIVWEAWLGNPTDHDQEIVVNKSRSATDGGKTLADYQRLLTDSFREAKRVVVNSGRISVSFTTLTTRYGLHFSMPLRTPACTKQRCRYSTRANEARRATRPDGANSCRSTTSS